jgi:hypothetical protein
VIEPRIYRAAFLPAVLAAVIAMFSLEEQPPALGPELAADVLFQGDTAAGTAEELARREPDRRPGGEGDRAAASAVAADFEEAGFEVEVDEFSEDDRPLENVVATRTGALRDQIVIMAARDADSVPDVGGSAADTAALLELARALEGRTTQKTLVLASVDGSTLGNAGARRFAETTSDSARIEAVLVLSDLGAGSGEPGLVAWSNDDSRASIGLERTATAALRQEIEEPRLDDDLPSQFAHLARPLGIGAQGVLLESDLEAVRFSGSGELPPLAGDREIDPDRLGAMGRAVLQTLSALDGGDRPEHGPDSYLIAVDSVLPGWALSILALTLILPALLASVDAFARARRRREPVGEWALWVAAASLPFVIGLAVALLMVLSGLAPDAPSAPPPPAAEPFDGGAAIVLGVVAAAIALGWIFARPLLARRGEAADDPARPGAGCAAALILSCAAVAVWAINPFAALALTPAVHLWTLAAIGDVPRAGARALLVVGGLVVPAWIAIFYLVRLSLDPLEGAWYLFLLVTGSQIGVVQSLLACVILGVLTSVTQIVIAGGRHRPAPAEELGPSVRGPRGYAGPGSLGGTESALKD